MDSTINHQIGLVKAVLGYLRERGYTVLPPHSGHGTSLNYTVYNSVHAPAHLTFMSGGMVRIKPISIEIPGRTFDLADPSSLEAIDVYLDGLDLDYAI